MMTLVKRVWRAVITRFSLRPQPPEAPVSPAPAPSPDHEDPAEYLSASLVAVPTPRDVCLPPVPGSYNWMSSHRWHASRTGLACLDCGERWPASATPRGAVFLGGFLDIDLKLAKRLWGALYPSEYHLLLVRINRIHDARSEQAILDFCKAVTPQLLLLLCARVAPEDGEPRDAAVVRAEASILERTDSRGDWR
jgi:hypothetical protein